MSNPTIEDAESEDLFVTNSCGLMKLAVERKSFSEKIERSESTIGECLQHIVAETQLFFETKKEYDKQVVESEKDRKGLDVLKILANRINGLYAHMFRLYSYDIVHIKKFMFFHTKFKEFISEDNDSFSALISKKHIDPRVYVMAARYIYHSKSDISAARRYLMYGISHHASYKPLYISHFTFEVLMMKKTNGDSLSIVLKKYKEYFELFKNDLKFLLKLFDKAFHDSKVYELQTIMIKDMIEKYSENVLMWKQLSKINYSGFIYGYDTGKLEYDAHCRRRMQNSFDAFENGIQANESPEKQKVLWKLYAQHIIGIRNRIGIANETIEAFLIENMKRVFQHAHDIHALPKEFYVHWAEFSIKEHDPVVVKRAIEMNKSCIKIWFQILGFYLNLNSFDMAYRVLNDGVQALEVNSLCLWNLMSFIIKRTKDKKLIDEFYNKAIVCQYEQIRTEYKVQYLKWYENTQGRIATRKLFKALKDTIEDNPELYKSMISFEKHQSPKNNSFINNLYVEMCFKYSRYDIGLWMDAIAFNYSEGHYKEAVEVFQSASSVLDQVLISDLKMKFERLKLGTKVKVTYPDGTVHYFGPKDD